MGRRVICGGFVNCDAWGGQHVVGGCDIGRGEDDNHGIDSASCIQTHPTPLHVIHTVFDHTV